MSSMSIGDEYMLQHNNHTYTHINPHTYIYTHTHTHTHTNTHTCWPFSSIMTSVQIMYYSMYWILFAFVQFRHSYSTCSGGGNDSDGGDEYNNI